MQKDVSVRVLRIRAGAFFYRSGPTGNADACVRFRMKNGR